MPQTLPARQRYTVVITKDPESRWYVAEVPALPGCVTQGETMDALVTNVREAIIGWLEVAKSRGDVRPPEVSGLLEVEVEVPAW